MAEDFGTGARGDASAGPEWSMQRRLTMKACTRRYWFEYVAVNDPAMGAEGAAQIKLLKRLNSIRFLGGLAVHTALRRVLPKLKAGEAPDIEAAVKDVGE